MMLSIQHGEKSRIQALAAVKIILGLSKFPEVFIFSIELVLISAVCRMDSNAGDLTCRSLSSLMQDSFQD